MIFRINPRTGSINDDNNNEQLAFSSIASAVNHIEVENSATGSGPTIRVVGGDTNADLILEPKGIGEISFGGSGSSSTIASSDASTVTSAGEDLNIQSGAGGSTSGDGGGIIIAAGDATSGAGGSVTLTPGSGSTTDGTVLITDDNSANIVNFDGVDTAGPRMPVGR